MTSLQNPAVSKLKMAAIAEKTRILISFANIFFFRKVGLFGLWCLTQLSTIFQL